MQLPSFKPAYRAWYLPRRRSAPRNSSKDNKPRCFHPSSSRGIEGLEFDPQSLLETLPFPMRSFLIQYLTAAIAQDFRSLDLFNTNIEHFSSGAGTGKTKKKNEGFGFHGTSFTEKHSR